MIVIGYHGTCREYSRKILSDGFELSRNEYDWLGDGIYFFQDAPNHAMEWAKKVHGKKSVVLATEINLAECMDLIDLPWANFLADIHDNFLYTLKENSIQIPRQTNGAHRLDRSVINFAIKTLEESSIKISSVRAAFLEGNPVYPNSALFEKSHIQIAVREQSIIQKVWEYEEVMEIGYDRSD